MLTSTGATPNRDHLEYFYLPIENIETPLRISGMWSLKDKESYYFSKAIIVDTMKAIVLTPLTEDTVKTRESYAALCEIQRRAVYASNMRESPIVFVHEKWSKLFKGGVLVLEDEMYPGAYHLPQREYVFDFLPEEYYQTLRTRMQRIFERALPVMGVVSSECGEQPEKEALMGTEIQKKRLQKEKNCCSRCSIL
jgi:hypothetical protein